MSSRLLCPSTSTFRHTGMTSKQPTDPTAAARRLRRHHRCVRDTPGYPLDALILRAIRLDLTGVVYQHVARPSLVFHFDFSSDESAYRNPLMESLRHGQTEADWDDRVFFESYLPQPAR